MDTKKILSAIVAGTMALSAMSFTALADEPVGVQREVVSFGKITPAYVAERDGSEPHRVWGEAYNCNANESFEVKVFSDEDLIATTNLNNIDGIIDGDIAEITWSAFFVNDDDYWTTKWESGHPNVDAEPTKVVLCVDGVDVDEDVVTMSSPDDLNKTTWSEAIANINAVAEVNGAKYAKLEKAIAAANDDDTVILLADVDAERFPAINKPLTFTGSKDKYINVNSIIAENFPNVEGTVTFQNINFNNRISTEHNSTDQSKLTLKFENCNFNVPAGTYAIQGGASWNNDVLGGLVIDGCTFTATEDGNYTGNYMIYAQCVNNVEITNSVIDGKENYRGAIHLGDSTEHATTALIEKNNIKNIERGVQVGNRVSESSVVINENVFENIKYLAKDSKKKEESAAIFVHANANADALDIVVTGNDFTGVENGYSIYSENVTDIREFVSIYVNNIPKKASVVVDTYQPNVEISDDAEAVNTYYGKFKGTGDKSDTRATAIKTTFKAGASDIAKITWKYDNKEVSSNTTITSGSTVVFGVIIDGIYMDTVPEGLTVTWE